MKTKRLVWDKAAKTFRTPTRKANGQYIASPIPVDWLIQAGLLPGAALKVGLMVWFRRGVAGASKGLSNELAAQWGVSRQAKRRAILELERAGLIEVERSGHQAPRVTVRRLSRRVTAQGRPGAGVRDMAAE